MVQSNGHSCVFPAFCNPLFYACIPIKILRFLNPTIQRGPKKCFCPLSWSLFSAFFYAITILSSHKYIPVVLFHLSPSIFSVENSLTSACMSKLFNCILGLRVSFSLWSALLMFMPHSLKNLLKLDCFLPYSSTQGCRTHLFPRIFFIFKFTFLIFTEILSRRKDLQ